MLSIKRKEWNFFRYADDHRLCSSCIHTSLRAAGTWQGLRGSWGTEREPALDPGYEHVKQGDSLVPDLGLLNRNTLEKLGKNGFEKLWVGPADGKGDWGAAVNHPNAPHVSEPVTSHPPRSCTSAVHRRMHPSPS